MNAAITPKTVALAAQRASCFAVVTLAEILAEHEGQDYAKLSPKGRSLWIAAALRQIDERLHRRPHADVAKDIHFILEEAQAPARTLPKGATIQ